MKRRAWEFLSDDGIEPPYAVCNHEADPFNAPVFQRFKDSAPSRRALCRNIEYAQNIAPAFICNGQCNIERLALDGTPAVDLDVHAVYEHHRVIAFQTAFQP